MQAQTDRLAALLAPPELSTARDDARRQLAAALQTPRGPAQLGEQLQQLLEKQQADAARLERELETSSETTNRLVADTRRRVARIRERSHALKQDHERVEGQLAEAKDRLVSGLEAKDPDAEDGLTLRERLVSLAERRAQLVAAQKWFGAVAKAESLG